MAERVGYALVIRLTDNERIVAVFRKRGLAYTFGKIKYPTAEERWRIVQTTWKEAVRAVRFFVFVRDQYKCVRCGKYVTWETGQMDERQDRGRGGEISIFNCRTLCGDCHIGPRGKHGKRASRFTRKRI